MTVSCDPACVTKNEHFLISEVSMFFQVGFMVFHGFWLVSMVFQGGFMVFYGFWLVSMGFRGGFMVFQG